MLSSSRSRANVAAQACDTCRRRKSRCNEERPKCSLCQRLNVECHYREQSPPRPREDSMAKMVETLERLEAKIDNLNPLSTRASSSSYASVAPSSVQQTPGSGRSDRDDRTQLESFPLSPEVSQERPPDFTAPHRTVVWPNIYEELNRKVPQASAQLAGLSEGGTPWLLAQEMSDERSHLAAEIGMPSMPAQSGSVSLPFATPTRFPMLTSDRIRSYAGAYFSTFNVVYPVLDEGLFRNETLPPLLADGFRYGDATSVLALYVLALGQLAIDSLTGAPIELVDGVPSGICGGTALQPPGLDIFNEGRARVGTLMLRGDIISVQLLLLQATYFEANACHVEYWRSIMEASMICQLLAQSPNAPWSTMTGDLLRRAFWTCVIDEDFYHIDLDLPRTGLGQLVDTIRLPNFSKALGSIGWTGGSKATSLVEFYFLSKVSLLRLISRVHQQIHYYSNQEHLNEYTGPPLHVIRELSRQLDTWRTQLPGVLQWSDEDLIKVPEEDPRTSRAGDYTIGMPQPGGNTPTRAGAEILAVELRARFYYARFILGRPFIFKALHFASLMNAQDAEYCVSAIYAACLWPAALAPARHKKRLLPHLFTWTQNFIALLTILWIQRHNAYLRELCQEKMDPEFVEQVIEEMLHWIRDVKQIDGIAGWSWHFLHPMFERAKKPLGM